MWNVTYVGLCVVVYSHYFSSTKTHPSSNRKKKDSKKAIYFWSSATAYSEKISKAEHNIVSTDCDAKKAEKQ